MNNGLIRETYHSFLFSLTLHDWWFIKRKIRLMLTGNKTKNHPLSEWFLFMQKITDTD